MKLIPWFYFSPKTKHFILYIYKAWGLGFDASYYKDGDEFGQTWIHISATFIFVHVDMYVDIE